MSGSHLDHKELLALRAMPTSEATKKAQAVCVKLLEERESVQPAIAKIMAKIDSTDTDEAVTKLTPLRIKQEVAQVKLDKARAILLESVVSDSATWMDASEAEVDAAGKHAHDTKREFEERVRQNFKHATMLLRGGNAAGSEEMRDAASRRAKATEQALLACTVRTLLDRQYQVDRVARGLAASGTGRAHVQPPEFYLRNAAEVAPELLG